MGEVLITKIDLANTICYTKKEVLYTFFIYSNIFFGGKMDDFLKFRKMITPVIIQVLFYVLAGLTALGGLGMMIASPFQRYGGGVGLFFSGLVTLVLGPVIVRIYCELLILFFRMNETLTEIKNSLAKK